MEFDFIGKVETLHRDFWHIVVENRLQAFFSKDNLSIVHNPTKAEGDRTASHLAELNRELLTKVLKLYENDFKIFDYDIGPYMRT